MRFKDVCIFLEWIGIIMLCCIVVFFDVLLKLYRVIFDRVVGVTNQKNKMEVKNKE